MTIYRTEERAYRRVNYLKKFGIWPGVRRHQDDEGNPYWTLSHNPDVWEMQ